MESLCMLASFTKVCVLSLEKFQTFTTKNLLLKLWLTSCTNLTYFTLNLKHRCRKTFNKWSFRKVFMQPPEIFCKNSVRKDFAKNSQENTCVGVFLINLQTFLLKRDSNTTAFLWILLNLYEHLFWKTSANNCFCLMTLNNKLFFE